MNSNYYIQNCNFKKKYHYKNAKICRIYDLAMSVVDILLTSGAALSLTILSVTQNDLLTVTVVQGIFLFLITVNSKIKSSMNFVSLNHRHLSAADDYYTLENEFNNISEDDPLYKYLVSKYVLTTQKLHVQEVKCFIKISDINSVRGDSNLS